MSEWSAEGDDSLARVDRLCDAFEEAWQQGQRPRIEDYLGNASGQERDALLRWLIPLDVKYRRQQEETPDLRYYLSLSPSLPVDWLVGVVRIGVTLADRYDVGAEIGGGGTAAVHRGQDRWLKRPVAVKVLRQQYQHYPEMVRRFENEARITSCLQHPGIVPVHDLGESSDGRPCITMKLVDGHTLAKLLEQRAAPNQDLPRFLSVFEQICQTLAYAHVQGVIHRDLKPHNIMVGEFGEVQVMDWGFAKELRQAPNPGSTVLSVAESTAIVLLVDTVAEGDGTQVGLPIGTLPYMPPEQARGEVDRMDQRSDVFGLGAILCAILTGRPPFTGSDSKDILAKARMCDHAEALARLDGCGADAELLRLARMCLAPQPQDRPGDAGVVAREMAAYLAGVQDRLRRTEVERAAAEAREGEAKAKARAERRARRLTVGLASSFLVLLTLGGGTFGWMAWQRAESRRGGEGWLDEALVLIEKRHYREARASIERAEQRLAGTIGNDDLRERAVKLSSELAMAARLQNVRERRTRVADLERAQQQADEEYRQAFQEYGIDVEALEAAEAAARLRQKPIWAALVSALDDWAVVRANLRKKQTDDGNHLLEAARLADPDLWRNELRKAMMVRDSGRLQRLAGDPATLRQPATHLVLLGLYLRSLGTPDAAVDVLRKAQRNYADDFWINHELGVYLFTAVTVCPLDEALYFCTAARSLNPNSPAANTILGLALLKKGDLDGALDALHKTTDLAPDWSYAHANLGFALSKKGDLDGALACCRKAIELDRGSAFAHANLADVLWKKGDFQGAEVEARKAIQLQPNLAEAHANLGNSLRGQQGRTDDALAAFQRASELKEDYGEALGNVGIVYLKTKQLDKALTFIDKAIAAFHRRGGPPDELAHALCNRGSVLTEKGKRNEALLAYEDAIRTDPQLAEAHYGLGKVLVEMGKRKEAIAAYQTAIKIKPSLAEAHCNLGILYWHAGKLMEAQDAFRRARDINPRLIESYLNHAALLCQQRKPQEAIKLLREGIHRRPDCAEAHTKLASVLVVEGQLDDAIVAFKDAAAIEPARVADLLKMAGALLSIKKYDKAIDALRAAISVAPNNAEAHERMGKVWIMKNEPGNAIKAYRKAAELDDKSSKAWLGLGMAFLQSNDPRQAIAPLETAVKLGPTALSHCTLGTAYLTVGNFAKAQAQFEEAIKLDEKDSAAHAELGLVRFLKNDFDGAIASCRKATALGRDDPITHGIHGKALFRSLILGRVMDQEEAIKEAIGAFHKSLRLAPDNAETWYDLGQAFVLQGSLDDAGKAFAKAVQRKPDYAEAHLLWGQVLINQGQFTEALKHLRRADELGGRLRGWPYPSRQWVASCDKFVELEKKCLVGRKVKESPEAAADCAELARVCKFKGLPAAAVDLYERAFRKDPLLAKDLASKHRYYAAQAAALAGCGRGQDAPEELLRQRLRRQALDWLRADLAALAELCVKGGPPGRAGVAMKLQQWRRDPDLVCLRAETELLQLPAEERVTWGEFWADVAALLKRAQEK